MARDEGRHVSLTVSPRPARLREGDVVVLLIQPHEVVAIPFLLPSPGKSVPLTENEESVLGEGGLAPGARGSKRDTVEASAKAYAALLARSLTVNQTSKLPAFHRALADPALARTVQYAGAEFGYLVV